MPKTERGILIVLSALLTLGLLEACTTTRTTATSDDVCLIWTPLDFSASGDTAETVTGIRELNARRDSYCGG